MLHSEIFIFSLKDLEDRIARKYVECGKDMDGRGQFSFSIISANHLVLLSFTTAPGEKTMHTLMLMEGIVPFEGTRVPPVPWDQIPYGVFHRVVLSNPCSC